MGILRFFGLKPKVDKNQQIVKDFFINYFKEKGIDETWWGVSKIEIKTDKHGVIVTVTLARPGLLIGKAGHNVRALCEQLSHLTGRSVSIKTVEFNPYK